jgi:hypothetical protein
MQPHEPPDEGGLRAAEAGFPAWVFYGPDKLTPYCSAQRTKGTKRKVVTGQTLLEVIEKIASVRAD